MTPDDLGLEVPVPPRVARVVSLVPSLTEAVAAWDNVVVEGFTGLLTDYCAGCGAVAVVKGLRAGSDFDYELQMAKMNNTLVPGVETVFLPTSPQHSFLASSLVKEVAALGGDETRSARAGSAVHTAPASP